MPARDSAELRQVRSAWNAQTAQDWGASRWGSWYLAASDRRVKRTLDPLRIHSDARIADEVEAIYIEMREPSRREMRAGCAYALRCWNHQHYTYDTLSALCWIAAQIRAVESVPVMLQIVKDYRSELFTDADETISVSDDMISILAGFVPDEGGRIEAVFDDLLFDDSVNPTFAATLAVAIASSDHSAFARCLNRFCAVRTLAPKDYYSDEDIVAAFAEAVPQRIIRSSVDLLSAEANEYWMRVGVRARRYNGEGYVLSSATLIGIAAEGRPDTRPEWPVSPQSSDGKQFATRYAIRVDDINKKHETREHAAGANGGLKTGVLNSLYSLAQQNPRRRWR